LPVSGNDLVAAGLVGPIVGEALARIRIAWLDGTVRTRGEVVALARDGGARGLAGSQADAGQDERPHAPVIARSGRIVHTAAVLPPGSCSASIGTVMTQPSMANPSAGSAPLFEPIADAGSACPIRLPIFEGALALLLA